MAFSEPTRTGVNQVLVTGPGAPAIASVDDLAGREVFIRKSSIYAESVAALNAQLQARGKPAVIIREAPEVFEDDDVLEMVNAGLVDATIADDYLAKFWSQVFKGGSLRSTTTSRCAPAVPWRSRCGRRTRGSAKPSTPGSRSTGKATRFATRSSSG